MNWANLFLVGCIWIFLPIVYVSMRNNTVVKKGIILSVTLPPEGQQDEEVQAYLENFRKRLRWSVIWLTAALLPSLLLPKVSLVITWAIVWMLAAMVAIFWIYAKGYADLKAIKRRRGWKTGTVQPAMEAAPLKLPKPIKTGWFVPPMILSVLPVISCIFDVLDPAWKMLLTVNAVVCLSITAGSLAFHGLIFRQKPDVVDDNSDRTAALTRVRRYNWTKTWLLLSWITGIFSVAAWIGQEKSYLAITMIYSAAILAVTLATEFAVRRVQHRLSGDETPVVDEDDYWIWGQFYYNPHDKKTFINERVGMGMSVNYATPVGKGMAVLVVVVLLGMLPLCGWLIADEMAVTELTVSSEAIVAQHRNTAYEIPMDEVLEAELLDELPPSTKIWGTATEHLLKGKFSVEGYGAATLCLNPQEPPFLMIKTAGEIYFLSGENAEAIFLELHKH